MAQVIRTILDYKISGENQTIPINTHSSKATKAASISSLCGWM